MNTLIEQNVAVMAQGVDLLDRLAGDEAQTATRSVGPHFRHCIDFYSCFLAGLKDGRVDYDERERAPELENDATRAAAELRRAQKALAELTEGQFDQRVEVRAEATIEEAPWTESTVARELLFLLSHTVHHYALIALLLGQEGIDVPAGFGVAPSTLEHAGRQPACAR